MIGQANLINNINQLSRFPNFSIFVGEKGSGKKTLIREMFDGVWINDISVASIRDMIKMSYEMHNQIFIIPDADNMSLSAKNSILKAVEECVNGNKFIMTLETLDNTLDTIKSRATVFYMDSYTHAELQAYIAECNITDTDEINALLSVCFNIGDINEMIRTGIMDLYNYANLVIDNIADVSGSNAFKIADKVALKNEADKYDLKLFWRSFAHLCVVRTLGMTEGDMKYLTGATITQRYHNKLRITGINKTALFDMWILDIREAWYDGDSET